jgi:RNA 2',3'-cyclic 3'-phosphodiesterase
MDTNREPGTEDVIRAFVAVEINDEVRESLGRLQDNLKKAGAKVGWVSPQNVHLTLVFLGDVFRAKIDPLGVALDGVAEDFKPFSYEAAETGFFGSAKSPRVIWVGVRDSSGMLADMQKRVVDAVHGQGLRTEERSFKPHLTLGRMRSRQRADELTSILASAKNTSCGAVEVQRLLLMQSHLEHQGVRYSILHASALKGAQEHGG